MRRKGYTKLHILRELSSQPKQQKQQEKEQHYDDKYQALVTPYFMMYKEDIQAAWFLYRLHLSTKRYFFILSLQPLTNYQKSSGKL
jgi:hypothetical protein